MTLHEKARRNYLQDNDFSLVTTEMLNERNEDGCSVWCMAACNETLQDIPKHLFTEECLSQIDKDGNSLWHYAAQFNTLRHIPEHLFTDSSLAQPNQNGDTVWHISTMYGCLKDIPVHLFSEEVLNLKNNRESSVLNFVVRSGILKDIPQHLITETLFHKNPGFFNAVDTLYINNVILERKLFNDFIENHPSLAKDIEFRDPRLELSEVVKHGVIFKFRGIDDKVILNKDGVAVGKNLHNSLNDAVLFIEKIYPHIEQSLVLPKNDTLMVGEFVL